MKLVLMYSQNYCNLSGHVLLLGVSFLVICLQLSAASSKCEKAAAPTEDKDISELLMAIKKNDPQRIQSIFDKGTNIEMKTASGDTLLHVAIICGCPEVLEKLIKLGLNPNIKNDGRESLFWTALHSNSTRMLQILKENEVDIGVKRSENGDSLLHEACRYGFDGMVLWLMDAGLEIDIRNKQTKTPLHVAVENGHRTTVNILISGGANVNSRTSDGNTPLHTAASYGHLAIVQDLISNGAKVNSTTLLGNTPLHKAAEGGHERVIEELLINGADPDVARTILGLAPLHLAAFNLNAVRALVTNGADINIPTFNGAKAIHRVGYDNSSDNSDVIQLLLEKGGDVNGIMKNGWTPLHLAALYGSDKIIQKLIYSGANLNAMDGNGRTPLHYVTIRNNLDLIELFIESGADVHVTDIDWETPYSWAMSRGLFGIADPLRGLNTEVL